jgi:hypothetical protein
MRTVYFELGINDSLQISANTLAVIAPEVVSDSNSELSRQMQSASAIASMPVVIPKISTLVVARVNKQNF